ncbi:hypothetical protein EXIGLDRAFT_776308 [Exidia glandulosa HHB12029]|uniref:Uncharacterized protein n=1 Tax=Exidia glandulosa HHB12029 TaxID=1314781 RepID=A0A165DIR0_EXIGL|nr:hypothetical protein EXIGLDRAFT_776308 [Exidia glandulosa HHB12029]
MSKYSHRFYGLTCTSTIPRVPGSLSDRLGRGHLVATPRAPPPSHPRHAHFVKEISKYRTKWIFPSRGCSLLLKRHEISYRSLPVEVTSYVRSGLDVGTVCKDGIGAFKHPVASKRFHELFTRHVTTHQPECPSVPDDRSAPEFGYIRDEDIYA